METAEGRQGNRETEHTVHNVQEKKCEEISVKQLDRRKRQRLKEKLPTGGEFIKEEDEGQRERKSL